MKKRTQEEWEELFDQVVGDTDKVFTDPETIAKAEEFHRKVSYISPGDLLRKFTI